MILFDSGMKTAVTIGTFDGVHRGHQEVLRVLRELAGNRLKAIAITFDRHPLEVVRPERAPRLLMTTEERERAISNEDVEVEILHFNEDMRRLSAREWMQILIDKYEAQILVLGYDNSFGCDGHKLTHEDYMRIGKEIGLEVVEAPAVAGCSSSIIRRLLEAGDVERSAELLGRSYAIKGKVVHGKELGRAIGFPTANLDINPKLCVPQRGVYSADAKVNGRRYSAVVNIGLRPTVDNSDKESIEVFMIDYEGGEIYGEEIILSFHARIRDEKKFQSLQDLKQQIALDVAFAKK